MRFSAMDRERLAEQMERRWPEWDQLQAPKKILAMALSKKLAETYDEPPVICQNCGFSYPDTLEMPVCPACGIALGAKGGGNGVSTRAEETEAEVRIVDVGPRRPRGRKSASSRVAEKRTDDKELARANEVQAEDKARKLLEKAEKRIEEVQAKGARLIYQLACQLKEIHDGDLWQARVIEMGYRSFRHYAKERWGIEKDLAFAYVELASKITAEQAVGLSSERLRLISRVPSAEDRERILGQINSGELKTTRDLAAAVKEARKSAGKSTEKKVASQKSTAQAVQEVLPEDTYMVSHRGVPGEVVHEGDFEPSDNGTFVLRFEIGGQTFEVVANEEDWGGVVRHARR